MVTCRLVKSKPPMIIEMTGITTSLTREVTMAVKAAPTTMPTARSTTLPRLINSLNSFKIGCSFLVIFLSLSVAFSMRQL